MEPNLELDVIERRDDGPHLAFAIDTPWFGFADDLVTTSLRCRITDRDAGVPETVTLDISGDG